MKLIITGGHLSPLLAVIDALPKGTKILVIGRKYAIEGDKALSLEYQTIKDKKNITFESISTGRLQRKLTRHTLFSLLKLPYGFFQSFLILKRFKPSIILTFGGYVSLPVVLVSFFLRIPIVIHEQTLEAGLANKIAAFFANKICLSWESSRKLFPKNKTVLTGNPMRKYQISPVRQAQGKYQISNENIPLIYITGGSLGSHAINELIEGCLKKLLLKFKIIHQTGGAKEYADFDCLNKLRDSLSQNLKERYFLTKFIDPDLVGAILQEAKLVVCRAGINTVTELIYYKKPSLLIPLPFSQNNEQKKNAVFLKRIGLGEIIDQDQTNSDALYNFIISMMGKIGNYKIKTKEFDLINPKAALRIIDVLKAEEKKQNK